MSIAEQLSILNNDEALEITPKSCRLRKAILDPHARKKSEKSFRDLGSVFLMTYTFKRKLMFSNKSPRRIDRRSGARNKKIILKSYQKIIKGKKNK